MTRFGAFLGGLCAAIVILISLQDPTFLGAEWLLQDAFTRRLAPRSPPDPRVILVSVNEKSVRTLDQAGFGKPPYSRPHIRARRTASRLSSRSFAILTAARPSEAIGARWSEIDVADRLWIIPAARMKANREHRVPLSDAAMAIIEEMAASASLISCFPGAAPAAPSRIRHSATSSKRSDMR